jgi:hypothetical protein
MGGMSYRLGLVDVHLNILGQAPYLRKEAYVVLSLQESRLIGRYTTQQDEDDLAIIANATLDGIKRALPVQVEFTLRNAIRLNPQFLDVPLLVVIAQLMYGNSRYELTGACQCDETLVQRGIAQATLDATNRLVRFILTEYYKTLSQP